MDGALRRAHTPRVGHGVQNLLAFNFREHGPKMNRATWSERHAGSSEPESEARVPPNLSVGAPDPSLWKRLAHLRHPTTGGACSGT